MELQVWNFLQEWGLEFNYIGDFFYHFQRKYIIFHLLAKVCFQVEWGMIALMNFF